jgi:hypothetical protein
MAVSKRNTASSHAQEPPLTIARVALYARVSTLNGQDPEMQLSELREYASRRGCHGRLLSPPAKRTPHSLSQPDISCAKRQMCRSGVDRSGLGLPR